VLGNFNVGKSFILQKISDFTLPRGYSVRTKGISIKFPKNSDSITALLDSAGFETPLILDDLLNDNELKEDSTENKKQKTGNAI